LVILYYEQNIIKPCWLVGQSVVGSGKTIQNQDAILEEFRTGLSISISFDRFLLLLLGIHNVMISTDVVQAGLNIPQCSLVLRYDVCRILVKESDLEFCL
jgi:superfamily II DNA/RNA helicase